MYGGVYGMSWHVPHAAFGSQFGFDPVSSAPPEVLVTRKPGDMSCFLVYIYA